MSNIIKQISVAYLCLALSAVEASRTSPAGVHSQALISNHLGVGKDPDGNEHPPLWEDEKVEAAGVKVKKSEATDTGVEPVDEVSRDVPPELKHPTKTLEKVVGDPEKTIGEPHRLLPHITAALILSALIPIFFMLLCLFGCGYCYQKYKNDPVSPPMDGGDHSVQALSMGYWRYGLFDCFHDSRICLITCCCWSIRWSDTMRMAGLMTFWAALIIMGVLEALNIMFGFFVFVLWALVVYRRQQIRTLFGMESGDGKTYCEDCCIYMWCCCCAIIQEARQLEEAYAVGYPLTVKEPLRRPPSARPVPPMQQPLPQAPMQQPLPTGTLPQSLPPQSLQRMPQPAWGQVQPPQPQPVMMTSLPPQQMPSQPVMTSLPPQQMPSQPVMTSLPPQQMPPQQMPPQQMPSQPVMQYTPPQSVQSLGPTPPQQYPSSFGQQPQYTPPQQYAQPGQFGSAPVMGSPTNAGPPPMQGFAPYSMPPGGPGGPGGFPPQQQ